MEPVGLATLTIVPRRAHGLGNKSPLWLGNALTTSGEMARLYLKRAAPLEMLSECLCAVLASALGLPVCKVYLVQDPLPHLDGELLIGSEDAGAPSLRQRLAVQDAAVIDALIQWRQLHAAALFDEWCLNWDRNQGNLLWDGAHWALIDHGAALGAMDPTTGAAVAQDTAVPLAGSVVANQLARLIAGTQGQAGVARISAQIARHAATCDNLDHGAVVTAARCDILGMSARAQHALSCLAERLDHLPRLLSRHGAQGELDL